MDGQGIAEMTVLRFVGFLITLLAGYQTLELTGAL
jgi:hypothetical protein